MREIPPLVKTGFLYVPERDEAARQKVYQILKEMVPGVQLLEETNARSQRNWIEETLRRWCDEAELDLIITIGGTFPAVGPSADQIVPEATAAILERHLPGLSEAMRAYAWEYSHLALLDRGVCGIRGRTVVINVPGGANAASLFLDAIVTGLPPLLRHLQNPVGAPTLEEALSAALEDSVDDRPAAATPREEVDTQQTDSPQKQPLDPEEFAAYLRRKERGRGD